MNITLAEKTPIINDLITSAQTLSNDPNNHKKKALLAGGTALGLGTYGLTNLRKTFPNAAPTGKISALRALTAFAFPAGIYYAVKNKDSKKDVAIGAGISLGGLATRKAFGISPKLTNKERLVGNKTLLKTSLPLAAALMAGTYAANELGKAKNIEQGLPKNNSLRAKYPIINTIPYINNFNK